MAENMVVSSANSSGSLELTRSPRARELVKVICTATGAGDTSNVYTCKFLSKPAVVIGGVGLNPTFSGRTVTFEAILAVGTSTFWVEVAEAL